MILLGAGESGKKTLFKQAQINFGEGLNTSRRRGYRSIIHSNIISSMQTLVERAVMCEEFSVALNDNDLREHIDVIKEGDDTLDPDLTTAIQVLWRTSAIQKVYADHYQDTMRLIQNAQYFFEKLDILAQLDYVPTLEDVLRSRSCCTGICKTRCDINGTSCDLFLTGGHRCERKKWSHIFKDTTCVIFVSSLNGYNQVLFEDSKQNRMLEDLTLFEEIVNDHRFKDTPILLLLNMKDIFAEKIEKVPLRVCPAFAGDSEERDYRSSLNLIRKKFLNQDKEYRQWGKTRIKTRFTNSLDCNEISTIYKELAAALTKKCNRNGGQDIQKMLQMKQAAETNNMARAEMEDEEEKIIRQNVWIKGSIRIAPLQRQKCIRNIDICTV